MTMNTPTSQQIGKDLEDRVEQRLQALRLPYFRGHVVRSRFGSTFTLDFWLPPVSGRPPIVLECKNFGVAAKSLANSRGRKAQETLYLLAHVRRHCAETTGARIVLVTGTEPLSQQQIEFLSAELGPDFFVTSIDDPEGLRATLLAGKP
jgi:hypothetical protein